MSARNREDSKKTVLGKELALVRKITTRTLVKLAMPAAMMGVMLLSTGCVDEPKSFLDPSQVGRLKAGQHTVPILPTLAIGADEASAEYAGARDVQQDDLVEVAADYTIVPNDVLSVSISDLIATNTESVRTIRVSQTGRISLPNLPQPIKVEGMTEAQVERTIHDAYRDEKIINDSRVTVSVIEARGRTYSVSGAVGAPNVYVIYDKDFRLLDALVAAHDVTSSVGIDTIYIVRKRKAGNNEAAPAPVAPRTGADPLAPQSMAKPEPRKSVMLMQDAKAPEGGIVVTSEGKEMTVNQPAATGPAGDLTPSTAPGAVAPMGNTGTRTGGFEFNALKEPDDREVIRIPYDALKSGQLKYNIIVRPGDMIWVPPPVVGEYYMGGNVQAPGAYSLAARKITLSQAIVAARGLNEVAWPSRTEIVRRLPGDKQIFVRVDLDKIFAGEESDIYLKPDDRVNVGTHVVAPFLAAFRNGFRLTYGFGFLYDRNYASNQNNSN
jgi:protein involved in polysaccharide export with SLBB domain